MCQEIEQIRKLDYRVFIVIVSIIVMMIGTILLNSIVVSGNEVVNVVNNRTRGNYYLSAIEGYDYIDGEYVIKNKDSHYLTFSHPQFDSIDGLTIVFSQPAKKDTNVKVWYMDFPGNVLEEKDVTWEKNSKYLGFTNPPNGTGMISVGIDSDFRLYEVLFSKPYSNKKPLLLAMILYNIVILLVFYIIYKKRWLYGFYNNVDNCIKSLVNNRKMLIFNILALIVDVIIAFLLVFGLSIAEIKLFDTQITLNYKTVSFMFVLLFGVSLLFINRRKLTNHLGLYATLYILLVGTMYAFLEPASNGVCLDDENHYNKIAGLSHIIDNKRSISDQILFDHYMLVIGDHLTYDRDSSKSMNKLYDELDRDGYFYNETDYKFGYQRIVYIPMAVGLCFARGLNLPYHIQIIFGRWFNILFTTTILYFALKRLKYGKIVLFLITLIPTNIFFASSYTYDIWLTAWSMLAFSYLFYEMQSEEQISKKSVFIMALAFLLSMIVKQVYFLMVIPALFIKNKKFANKKNNILYRLLMLFVMFLPFIISFVNNMLSPGYSDTRGGDGVSAGGQVDFFKSNPVYVFKVILLFLKDYLNPIGNGKYYHNYLAYNGLIEGSVITLLIVVIGSVIAHEDVKKSFPVWFRIGMGLLYVAVGGICAFALYITFTPVGADFVNGCQARYIIPAIFPLVFTLTRIPIKTYVKDYIREENYNMIIMGLMFLMNCFCILKGCILAY